MKGRRQVREGFLSTTTIETKYLSAFERGLVVGARRTGSSVSRIAKLGVLAYAVNVSIETSQA
jgi:hypothetical protein